MAFVPGFKHDVFVSYAHFDNEPDTQDIRWVSRFQADLKTALRQRLGTEPSIFFDTRSLQAHHELDVLTENARRHAASSFTCDRRRPDGESAHREQARFYALTRFLRRTGSHFAGKRYNVTIQAFAYIAEQLM